MNRQRNLHTLTSIQFFQLLENNESPIWNVSKADLYQCLIIVIVINKVGTLVKIFLKHFKKNECLRFNFSSFWWKRKE